MTATELLMIVVDSDRVAHEQFLDMALAEMHRGERCDQVRSGTWTVEQAQRFLLAEAMKDHVELLIDDVWPDCADPQRAIVTTLVRVGFEELDWHEAADHYIAKVHELSA